MDQRVRPGFQRHENEGNHSQNDLEAFRPFFSWCALAPSPLRRGTVAQVVNPRDYGEIDGSADGCEDEHGDADGILVPTGGGGVNAAGRCQGR